VLVLLSFSSADPCWFDLRPDTPTCGDNSPSFSLLPVQRTQGESKTTLGLLSSTSSALVPSKTGTDGRSHTTGNVSGGELSSGAKAGIIVAVVGAILVVLGMAACFFFRRRKRLQEAVVAGHIIDHDSRAKKGHEKMPLAGGSTHSNGSTEPLRVQPVYDGIPGSAGYNDLQSRGSSAYLHSPQSPSSSAGGFVPPSRNKSSERQYSTEREELEAARLHSTSVSSGVVSYGPNPVTPSVTPRPSTRFHDNPSSGSRDELYPPSTHTSTSPQPQAEYPLQPPAQPLIVSYGPNRITPTPAIVASVAPEESVMKGPPDLPSFPDMGIPSHPFPSYEAPSPHDTIQHTPDDLVRYDLSDEPLSAVAPLPPYASTADFYAMEKGAIRKLQEPAAQAELPPTKDGYYHFGDHGTEYELQGAAPEREQQLPHQPYRNQTAGVGRARGVDEQKFLLDDGEMRHLREQKRRIRAAQHGESYEMQPAGRGGPGQEQGHN